MSTCCHIHRNKKKTSTDQPVALAAPRRISKKRGLPDHDVASSHSAKRAKAKGKALRYPEHFMPTCPTLGRWRTPPPPSSSAHRDESAGGRLATVGAAVKGGEGKEIRVICVGVVRVFESRNGGHHRVHQLEDSRPVKFGRRKPPDGATLTPTCRRREWACAGANWVHTSFCAPQPHWISPRGCTIPIWMFLDAPDPMAGFVLPNSNLVWETVVTIDLLNPIRPSPLNLVNRLLSV
ncbi:hypothetical protein GQ457_01G013290 [Hibiscus cannabinus]